MIHNLKAFEIELRSWKEELECRLEPKPLNYEILVDGIKMLNDILGE